MKTRRTWPSIGLAIVASAMLCLSITASAQASQDEQPKEIVKFRLTSWKSLHLHDEKAATQIYETLKNLGCEVEKHAHGNHTDVKYRCSQWRSIALKTHEDAHKWEKWFKGKGFQTEHKH